MPPTTPTEFTVAIAVALLLHDPPVIVLLSVVVAPVQRLALPAMLAGTAFTVTAFVADAEPQLPDTV